MSVDRRIGVAALIWGASVLLSRMAGIVREAAIGRILGGGAEADVFWASFTLPDWLNYLLAGGAVSIVFIPLFAASLARGDEAGAWRTFNGVFNGTVLVVTAFTALLWVQAPQVAGVVAPGFDEEQRALWVHLTRIVLPAQVFHLAGGLLSATLQARDQHALPALATLGYTGGILALGLLLGPTLGAEGFAWGVLLGSVVGPFGLPLVGCLRAGLPWRPLLDVRDPALRTYLWLTLPIMLAFSVVAVDDWVLRRLGSLLPDGTISELQYAKTLMKVPMGVFGLATGAAAYPTLSRLVAEGRPQEAYDTLVRTTRAVLVLAFVSQAAFTAAGADMAEVIWGLQKLTPQQVTRIGTYTGVFCLALWAWSANSLVARGFYAVQATWVPSLVGTVVLLAALPVYGAFAGWWGGLGLGLASSLAVSVYSATLAVLLRRRLGSPGSPRLWPVLLAMGLAAGAGMACGLGLRPYLEVPPLLRGAVVGAVAAGVTLAAGHLLRVPEVGVVVRLVRRRLLRR